MNENNTTITLTDYINYFADMQGSEVLSIYKETANTFIIARHYCDWINTRQVWRIGLMGTRD